MAAPYLLSFAFLLLLIANVVASSSRVIRNLPGFDGDLPFKLETGYIGVGELDDVQLFYYFIESEGSPEDDPLVLWLTGGPGCSAFSGLVYEIGPLAFDYENCNANSLKFLLNPYSWTQVSSFIFLDAPVGTGFSYANTWQGYIMNDMLSAAQIYHFLIKWLKVHSNFLANPLYIAGDSYSGKIVPIVVQEISDGIDAGHEPGLNLKVGDLGYVLGNPATDDNIDQNSKILFAYLKALITSEIYESAKRNCKGEYVDVDPRNGLCIADLQNITACTGKVNRPNIFEPKCSRASPRPKQDRSIIEDEDDSVDYLFSPIQSSPRNWCRNHNYFCSTNWANEKIVQRALGIREGKIKEWQRCNQSLSYTKDIPSVVDYHRNLINKGYQVLIYSGDVDMAVPYVGTETWIKSLNLTIGSGWQPWFVGGQVAGYWMQYEEKNFYRLTYATVKGAGHTAPEYKPKECLAMIDRWFASYPL